MLVKLYEKNPSERELQRIVGSLERGELIAYPTDSVYAVGCSLHAARAIDQLRRMKGAGELTVMFDSLAQVAAYCRVDNAAFRMLKRNLPGPFTFLLPALSHLPDKALEKRRSIGVRIPANAIPRAIVEALGCPMLTVSVKDEEMEYTTDPELIDERYGKTLAWVVDGGKGNAVPTTVVDLTGEEPVIVREGKGELQ